MTLVLFCACTDVASRSIAMKRNRALKKFEETILKKPRWGIKLVCRLIRCRES